MTHPAATAMSGSDAFGAQARTEANRDFLFTTGFAVAGVIVAAATLITVSGAGPVGPGSVWLIGLLAVNMVLIVALALRLFHRLRPLAEARMQGGGAGAKLQLRFAGLFSLAAVVPAIVVALFLGFTLARGVEAWFSQQVRTVVESSADISRVVVDSTIENLRADIQLMAEDLSAAAANVRAEPERFRAYLGDQAIARGFDAAIVMNRQGVRIAEATSPGASALTPPSEAAWRSAEAGDVAIALDDQGQALRALFRLESPAGTYLYVVASDREGVLRQMRGHEAAVLAWREAEARSGAIQFLFALGYGQVALLVLLGSAWLGLAAATRISGPVGRLAVAAEQVAGGDLSARVDPGEQDDEVANLARTFNRMTEELGAQRAALTRAREEAELRRGFIETVLTGVTAGVLGVRQDGTVAVSNPSAAALLGLTPEALVDANLREAAPELADAADRATPGAPVIGQIDRDVAGETRVFAVRAARDPRGADVVVTFDDITQILSAQREAAWKDVARRIAHEIKNPLTPIQLSAERLKRKYAGQITTDPDTFHKCTDTIVRQVKDIGRMVDEFSSFARMPTPRMADIDLREVLRESAFAQRLVSADTTVTVAAPDDPVMVRADARLIAQAVGNVLKNANEAIIARRAAGEGPEAACIAVALSVEGPFAIASVTDNGVGLPTRDRARLFEPYVTTREKGTGLGLAIVKRALEEHGGRLELADPPDGSRGACVRLVLPLLAESAQAESMVTA
jgi:two-component system, NtrC family, nitrogen regulation sensor histidine kinase NtrY